MKDIKELLKDEKFDFLDYKKSIAQDNTTKQEEEAANKISQAVAIKYDEWLNNNSNASKEDKLQKQSELIYEVLQDASEEDKKLFDSFVEKLTTETIH